MKTTILFSLMLIGALSYGQQKKPAPAAAKPAAAPAATSSTPASGEKEQQLCKAWKVTIIEVFGTTNAPEGKQANDGVTFINDGTAFLTIDGVAKTGKWSFDKPKANVTIAVDGTTEKFRFKVISLTADEFKYEYQDPELIRTKYTCQPLKK
jgi:hypothetical protein